VTSRERTILKYYSEAIKMLQKHVSIATDYAKLREELIIERPKFFWKIIWEETVTEIIDYVKNHKDNFKEGKLYV